MFAVSISIVAALLAIAPTRASVELDVTVNLRFAEGCAAMSGYWGAWDASTQPDRDALFGEYPPEPVNWSPTQPIVGDFVGGPSQLDAEFWLLLFAPDKTTVLFETQFDLVDTGLTLYWSVDTTVDCSSVPFQDLSPPNTSLPRSAMNWPIFGGLVLLVCGVGTFLVRVLRSDFSRH